MARQNIRGSWNTFLCDRIFSISFSADWFIASIVGSEAFIPCHQINWLVLIKIFIENDKIYGWNLILSHFMSQPLTGSVQKTFVGSCDFSVVWHDKYQGGVDLRSWRISCWIYSMLMRRAGFWTHLILCIVYMYILAKKKLINVLFKKMYCSCFVHMYQSLHFKCLLSSHA